ncbi:MAG: SAM-dependent methyltransferase [Tepidisphaerales bacterium]
MAFASRAGLKLEHALTAFHLCVKGVVAADFGCNIGGFTDCLLQHGAARVYAIDTGYGVLDYRLRRDGRVVVMERTNAMHVQLPEPVDVVVIDVGWTRQKHILPSARRVLRATAAADGVQRHDEAPRGAEAAGGGRGGNPCHGGGVVVSLVKPHYEAEPHELRGGVLREECLEAVLARVWADVESAGFVLRQWTVSPVRGSGGNAEVLALLTPADGASQPRLRRLHA